MMLATAGDINNPYPYGQVFANPGFDPWPTYDYTFRTYFDATSTEAGSR